MVRIPRPEVVFEVIRYYIAGALNAGFGYGLFAVLLWTGLGMYAAQATAHVLGVAFNYFTYSRHVFRNAPSARMRFIASYGVNYIISLAFLALVSLLIDNPYIAGLVTIILTSVVNYFMLKRLVFVVSESA